MRSDAIGLFWQDLPKPPPPVRTPPPRTWEEADYLPRLDEARQLHIPPDNHRLLKPGEPLLFDIEIYPNYFLAAFQSIASGTVAIVETTGTLEAADCITLRWLLEKFLIVTFNGNFFDLPLTALALAGRDCGQIKAASSALISEEMRPYDLLKREKVKALEINTIDLITVAPLSASLKIYAARLHAPRLQELPFRHDTTLNDDQISIVRLYCTAFDLPNTGRLWQELQPQLELRAKMGPLYGLDLRSKSDSQMAEVLVCSEIERLNGRKPKRPEIPAGTVYRYQVPKYISYQTQTMRDALATIAATDFVVQEAGGFETPAVLADLTIALGSATYTMGIGGLHSNEKSACHWSDDETMLIDRDVASYYPAIILNLGIYPEHIGVNFLHIYRNIVEQRLAAKKAGDKVKADTLKIAVNGTFGKLGNKWSPLYAPNLMLQVTLTGQLSLLMLIESLELGGFQVCSANTDGLLIKCDRYLAMQLERYVMIWEANTGFKTEESKMRFVCSRDVNNYIAVKEDGKVKVKGAYCERGSAGDSVLSKNPESLVAIDAAIAWLKDGVPLMATIQACRDIRRFVTVRTVTGGAVKDGEYLGKAIRWYFVAGQAGEIIYANTGNKVPNSDGARPVMDLPQSFPDDIDYARYEAVAAQILTDVGIV